MGQPVMDGDRAGAEPAAPVCPGEPIPGWGQRGWSSAVGPGSWVLPALLHPPPALCPLGRAAPKAALWARSAPVSAALGVLVPSLGSPQLAQV